MGTYLEEFSPEHFNMLKLAGMHWWLVLECDVCVLIHVHVSAYYILMSVLCSACHVVMSMVWYLVTRLWYLWSDTLLPCYHFNGQVSGDHVACMFMVWYLMTMLWYLWSDTLLSCPWPYTLLPWSGIWLLCCHVQGPIWSNTLLPSPWSDIWLSCCHGDVLLPVSMVWCINV